MSAPLPAIRQRDVEEGLARGLCAVARFHRRRGVEGDVEHAAVGQLGAQDV